MGAAQRIQQALIGRPWAITPDALRVMLDVAARINAPVEAVEQQIGRKLENTQRTTERNRVAVVPVIGPIMRYANMFTEISGATSVQMLARDIDVAVKNPDIRAILLNIDSPGGEVNGVAELAAHIYQARGTKPIYAYIGGLGCSAAYWLASAADRIICDATASVGSIGVIASIMTNEEDGEVVMISSQSPRKRANPRTEQGRADIQQVLDDLCDVFVDRVAAYRGVSVETVLERYGQGGIFIGSKGVDAGLVDEIGSFEGTLAMLANGQGVTRATAPTAMHTPALTSATPVTATQPAPILTAMQTAIADHPATTSAPPVRAVQSIPPTAHQEDVMANTTDEPFDPVLDQEDPSVKASIDAFTASMTAQQQRAYQQAMARANADFERRIKEQEQLARIDAFVHKITTPSLTNPQSLATKPEELKELLVKTPAAQRGQWMTLLTSIVSNGLISFDEIGSSAYAEATSAWEGLINANVAAGMKRSEAIVHAMKTHPDLYAAQSQPKKRGR